MPEIIVDRGVVEDDWQVLRAADGQAVCELAIPDGRVLLPLALWRERHDELSGRTELGVWLAGSEDPALLAPWLDQLAIVAIEFAKFTDGRGYSIAFALRSRYGYRGQLRAIGDVLPDQLFLMRRVGFDAFAVRPDKDIRKALALLQPFSDAYQSSWDEALPAYRRHARGWPAPSLSGTKT
jgi:uncharacterized protein (DUF934 family)